MRCVHERGRSGDIRANTGPSLQFSAPKLVSRQYNTMDLCTETAWATGPGPESLTNDLAVARLYSTKVFSAGQPYDSLSSCPYGGKVIWE
jgi:hypothetical protein